MLGRLHVIPPLFSKVEMEFGTAQDSARDLAEHFGVWLKRGVKKNLLCVFHNLERRTDTPFGSIGKFKEKPDLPESEAAKSPHCLALLLSGMPGTGKTRLAKQIVTELSDPLAKLAGLLVGDALPRPAPGANGVEVGVDL